MHRDPPPDEDGRRERDFAEQIAAKADRRRRAETPGRSILSWLGAFGMVGWSVVLPAMAGVLAGRWLDDTVDGPISWTLTLLLLGLVLGAAAAWSWLSREGGRDD